MLSTAYDILLAAYDDQRERCGFIVAGEVIEVENICDDPSKGFSMRSEDILRHMGVAEATWHTHPSAGSNLSGDDWHSFHAWPKLRHYITGRDGIRCYEIRDNTLIDVGIVWPSNGLSFTDI